MKFFILSISFSSFKIFFYHFGYSLITLLISSFKCELAVSENGIIMDLEVCKKKENLALEFMEVDHSKLTAVGFSHYIPSLGLDNLTIQLNLCTCMYVFLQCFSFDVLFFFSRCAAEIKFFLNFQSGRSLFMDIVIYNTKI